MTLRALPEFPPLPDDPRDLSWRLSVAMQALMFFQPFNNIRVREAIGKPNPRGNPAVLTVADFVDYLGRDGVSAWPSAMKIKRLIDELVQCGWLEDAGNPMNTPVMGNAYWAIHEGPTQAQAGGFLYLSSVVGPELIIRTYGAATIPITGVGKSDGRIHVGTGFALDDRHLLTNAHVVKGMTLDDELETSAVALPEAGVDSLPPWHVRVVKVHCPDDDDATDVAVVEVEPGSDMRGLVSARGVAFRDPEWADRVLTFGYPPVPRATTAPLVVHHGEVVNPSVPTFEGPAFLYSAVTRPGNSGGPIVARDGRIVGIVAHEVKDQGRPEDAAYYRALPASVVVGALRELGLEHLASVEDWKH